MAEEADLGGHPPSQIHHDLAICTPVLLSGELFEAESTASETLDLRSSDAARLLACSGLWQELAWFRLLQLLQKVRRKDQRCLLVLQCNSNPICSG